MRESHAETGGQSLRERLIAVIEASDLDLDGELTDDTSLIRSGQLDSLGLFNVAVFIEREVGRSIDYTSFDLPREWDTVNNILGFIRKQAGCG